MLSSFDAPSSDFACARRLRSNTALAALTGSSPKPEILDRAWDQVTFTPDPLTSTLVKSAEDAVAVGLLEQGGLDAAGGRPGTLSALAILTPVLSELGLPGVSS